MSEFMQIALEQAKIAFDNGDVPVGSVIVRDGDVIGKSYNRKNKDNISIYHAEILSIIEACEKIGNWHLDDCELYVTLKPCEMCLNAIAESRIKKVYYLLDSYYCDNLKCNYNGIDLQKINAIGDYEVLLKSFFTEIRSNVSRET